MIEIDADLPAGKWVLNWRMDQEESNQIWQSASALQRAVCTGSPPPLTLPLSTGCADISISK